MNGVLIIDKPVGLTSHDVVNRVRRILHERSVGHLGTLDPMASGVLPLVIGNLTRLAQFYTKAEKVYEGTIHFGFATDTYDAEGKTVGTPQDVVLQTEEVEALAAHFRGVIEQTPPPFSAKKIHGVPAYKLARKQKEVVLKPVQVEIKELEILSVEGNCVHFRARVASGTYLRSVAHDMGQRLGCGAHLSSLRRTAVAEFTLADAHTLEELADSARMTTPRSNLVPPQDPALSDPEAIEADPKRPRMPRVEIESYQAPEERRNNHDTGPAETADNSPPVSLAGTVDQHEPRPAGRTPETLSDLFIHPRNLLPELPSVTVDDLTAARIRSGRSVNLPDLSRARQIKVFQGQKDLLAIATRIAGTLFHPGIVLCGADTPVRRL